MELEVARDPLNLAIEGETLTVTPIGEGVFRFAFRGEEKVVVIEGDRARLLLLPAYLDRPVLLMFTPPLELAPRGRGEIYASLPTGLEVVLMEGETPIPVLQIPPPGIKKAWFGDMEGGALVYAARSPLMERPEDHPPDPYRVILPLVIRNEDRDRYELKQLLVDSYQLSIYAAAEGRRVAEVVEVTVREDRLEVFYTDRPPRGAGRELRKGEESARLGGMERLARRTFSRWKKLLRPFDAFGN